MHNLKHLKSLERLDLTETRITDASLQQLAGLKQLRELDLHFNKVSPAAVKDLQRAIPKLDVRGVRDREP